MQLSKLQRRNLEVYRVFHDQPPTVLRLFRVNTRRTAFILIYFLTAAVIMAALERTDFVIFIAGLVVGALSSDWGKFRATVLSWPALNDIIDWNRVDELLDNDTTTINTK